MSVWKRGGLLFGVLAALLLVAAGAHAQEPSEAQPTQVAQEDDPSVAPPAQVTAPHGVQDDGNIPADDSAHFQAPGERPRRKSKTREWFDTQTMGFWQYMRPHLLLRTGAIYEEFDETSMVLRQAGFKLWDAQLGFLGRLDPYRVGTDGLGHDWKFHLRYIFTGNFASGSQVSDAYVEGDLHSWPFSVSLRLGVQKVPFLYSELQSDSQLYFYDRPQYVKPYGSHYLTDLVRLGMGRHVGSTLRLGFLDDALTLTGGVLTDLAKPVREVWGTSVYVVRGSFTTKDWIHERIRFELGSGYFHQFSLPQIFENSRQGSSADARFYAYGAFIGGEWALQIMDDAYNADIYERYGFKNTLSWAMGYQVYAGYSFVDREYEIVLRYQWWDPDDTNIHKPIPQLGNQARRWLTVAASWWPVDLVRVMLQYTHRWELEAVPYSLGEIEFTESRLLDVKNDEVVFMLQLAL